MHALVQRVRRRSVEHVESVILRALVVVFAVVLANTAGAQERQRCTITSQAKQLNEKLPSGQYNSFFGGPVVVVCPAKDLTLHSDSLESYGDEVLSVITK